jgi:hypothetical protein
MLLRKQALSLPHGVVGDVVWFSPGETHWHGAAPTTAMTHIAIQEKLDAKPVDWLAHVTPEQYEERSGGS